MCFLIRKQLEKKLILSRLLKYSKQLVIFSPHYSSDFYLTSFRIELNLSCVHVGNLWPLQVSEMSSFHLQGVFCNNSVRGLHLSNLYTSSISEHCPAPMQCPPSEIQSDSLSMFPHGLFQPINHCSCNHHSSLLVSTHTNLLLSCGYKIPFSINLLLSHEGRLTIDISSNDYKFEARVWISHYVLCRARLERLNVIRSSSHPHKCEF